MLQEEIHVSSTHTHLIPMTYTFPGHDLPGHMHAYRTSYGIYTLSACQYLSHQQSRSCILSDRCGYERNAPKKANQTNSWKSMGKALSIYTSKRSTLGVANHEGCQGFASLTILEPSSLRVYVLQAPAPTEPLAQLQAACQAS